MILSRSTYNQNFEVPDGSQKLTTVLIYKFGDSSEIGTQSIRRTRTIPSIDTASVDLQFDQFIKDRLNPKPVWFAGTSAIIDSSEFANLWTSITYKFDDDSFANKVINSISTKGWYNYTQGLNHTPLKRFLTPSNYLQVKRGEPIIIPIHVVENAEVRVAYGSGNPTFGLTLSTLSTKRIQYLFFDEYDEDDKYITISYEGASEQGDIVVEIIDECKFDVKQLIYLNRFGVFQQLFCFKRSTTQLRTTQETFKNAFISGGTYDTTKHQYKDYNKQGRESLEVNTGFVKEEQNALIEDLMLSEDVYMREGGVFIPVNLDQKSLTFLTRKVDKVLNYTFNLEYSFDKIVNL